MSRDLSHNIWGLGGGVFQRGAGEFGDRGGKGHFQPLEEASQAVLRLHRTHQFLPPPIALLFLGRKVCPRVVGPHISI